MIKATSIQDIMKRLPNIGQKIQTRHLVALTKRLIRVENDIETMPMHPSTWMAGGYLRELMGSLKTKTVPKIKTIIIQCNPVISGTLNPNHCNGWEAKTFP
jgi:hypothetical protein